MGEPKSKSSKQIPLERLKSLRVRHRQFTRPQIVAQPDAINETLRANGTYQRQDFYRRAMKDRQRRGQEQQGAQSLRRSNYRARKRAERKQAQQNGQANPFEFPVELMSDAAIDAAIEQERRDAVIRAKQPQIGPANPVWSYPAETRRALGYYTQEEREQAARLNDMRSSTFLGNVMPNFGRQAAYNNPGAEMDAFRQTALYMPNAVVAGSSFGLPSATQAAIAGAKAGWQTAGNLAGRTFSAGTQAVKSAAPIVTNPRWAATTAAFTVPAVAQASDGGDYTGLGFGIGIPLAIGAAAYLTKGKLWGKTPTTTTTPSVQYVFKPKRGLFTWEYPTTWVSRQRQAFRDQKLAGIMDEWGNAVGDPTKEQSFINKYNIREAEGTPQYVNREVTKPKTYRAPKMETVQEPVMESVPSSDLGTDGQPIMIQKPKLNADGSPVMQSVEREVKNANGKPVMYNKPVLDDQGKPVMKTLTIREPKLGEDGQQIIIHNPISRDQVPSFLEGNLSGYTSNIPDVNDVVFRGPTESQQFWMRARNVGRVATWLGVPGFIGYKWLTSSSTPTPGNTTTNPNGDAQTDSTITLPTGFRPVQGVNDSTNQIVVPDSAGKSDSIITIEPVTRNRFGRGGNQNQ